MKIVLLPAALAAMTVLAAPGDSIVPNGDFEQADPANPNKAAHWEAVDGLGVAWTDAPAVPGEPPHGKAIRMNNDVSEKAMMESYAKAGLTKWIFPNPVDGQIGLTYGLSLYSEPEPVLPGKIYKVSFDYMSGPNPEGKLYFRGYKIENGQEKMLYESLVDCKGQGTKWVHLAGTFHPTRHTPDVTEFKIMLYGFDWLAPGGLQWFDNIKVTMEDDPDAPPPGTAEPVQ
jgi:hypothetical protein